MKKDSLIKKYGLNNPFRSWRRGKKKAVFVKTSKNNIKTIHYGATGYQDFTQHKDKNRRRLFRKRMGCDPTSNLKKDTAKYWACEDLW